MKYEVLSARLEPAVLGWDQNCFVFVKNESGDIDQFVVSRHGEILDAGDIEAISKDLQEAVKASAREAFESEPNQLATIENLLVSTQHFFFPALESSIHRTRTAPVVGAISYKRGLSHTKP